MNGCDKYKCIIPTYRDGTLYKCGDTLFLPTGTEYKGNCFVLEKKAKEVSSKTVSKTNKKGSAKAKKQTVKKDVTA